MSDEPKEKGTLERLVPVILDTMRVVELEQDKIRGALLRKEQQAGAVNDPSTHT